MDTSTPITTVDAYIAQFPADIREKLEALRAAIRQAAPEAKETISYRMPAYMQNGPVVYFAAFKRHIGLYPTASGIEAFKAEFAGYASSKGAVQFPLDKPLPLELVGRIVRWKVEENHSPRNSPEAGRA